MAEHLFRKIPVFLAAGMIISLSGSCKNPMGMAIRQTVEDFSRPLYTIAPGDENGISRTTNIKITFSESMDTTSFAVSGTMASEGCNTVWSAGKASDDTLTISPQNRWSAGSDKSLVINGRDPDGYAIRAISLNYGILDGIVYVHAEKGNDSFPGTQDKPKQTIQAAVDLAELYYDEAEVHVAEGGYYSKSIIIVAGISLLGGFSKTDWSEREINPNWAITENYPLKYPTSILVEDGNVLICLNAYKTIRIEGFIINCWDNNFSGIICDNVINVIRRNIIFGAISLSNCNSLIELNTIYANMNDPQEIPLMGGIAIQSISYGITTSNGTDIIQNNIIRAGLTGKSQVSVGISSISDIIVRGNEIDGGSSSYMACGIMNGANSKSFIYNNIIKSGIVINEGTGGLGTTGISVTNADSIIQNNCIIAGFLLGTGLTGETGISINNSNNSIIENNIILTDNLYPSVTRIGISLMMTNINSVRLKNNNIIDYSTAFQLFSVNFSIMADIDELNEALFASGNISLDPGFADKLLGDYHLTASSPPEVRQGGLDLSAQFTEDKEGNTRTAVLTGYLTNEGAAGWSMGAYESD